MITFKTTIDHLAPDKDLAELLGAGDVLFHLPLTNKEDSDLELIGVKPSNQWAKALHTLPTTDLTSRNVDG